MRTGSTVGYSQGMSHTRQNSYGEQEPQREHRQTPGTELAVSRLHKQATSGNDEVSTIPKRIADASSKLSRAYAVWARVTASPSTTSGLLGCCGTALLAVVEKVWHLGGSVPIPSVLPTDEHEENK